MVVVGHLDSGQTPVLFRSQLLLLGFVLLALLTVAALGVNGVLYLVSAITGVAAWWPIAAGVGVLMAAAAFALDAELSPYTQGANDNASSVGVALAIAGRAVRAPLRHTRVTALLSGCEEVGCYGMIDFLARRRDELADARFIVLEGVGGGPGSCTSASVRAC